MRSLTGGIFGPAVAGAFDPTIDRLAERLKDVSTHLANALSNVLAEHEKTWNAMAKERLEQLSEIFSKNLDKANSLLADRIKQLEDASQKFLVSGQAILTNAIDQANEAARQRIDQAGDRLDFANGVLSANAHYQLVYVGSRFGRSQVAGFAMAAVFLVAVLAVFAVIRGTSPQRTMAAVGVGLVLIGGSYFGYEYYASQYERRIILPALERADQLERIGDYRSAVTFRIAALGVLQSSDAQYAYERTVWLRDYLQPAGVRDVNTLTPRLEKLQTDYDQAATDQLLQAAAVHFAAFAQRAPKWAEIRSNAERVLLALGVAQLRSSAFDARAATKYPDVAKYAWVALTKSVTTQSEKPVIERLADATQLTNALIAAFPKYGTGRAIRAELVSATAAYWDAREHELLAGLFNPKFVRTENLKHIATTDLVTLMNVDPGLYEIVTVADVEVPEDIESGNYEIREKVLHQYLKVVRDRANRVFGAGVGPSIWERIAFDVISRHRVERSVFHEANRQILANSFVPCSEEELRSRPFTIRRKYELAGDALRVRMYAVAESLVEEGFQCNPDQKERSQLTSLRNQVRVSSSQGDLIAILGH